MKKLIYLLFAIVLFSSCEKDNLSEKPTHSSIANGDLPEVIYATVADNDSDTIKTRTFVDGKSVLWHNGDAIAYIAPTTPRAKYQNETEDGVASAEFTPTETEDKVPEGASTPETTYAVYPYSSGAYYVSVVNSLMVNFPTEQNYAANSFGRDANVMVAAGESADDIDFYFRNACGYLVVKLYGAGVSVKNIELTALSGEKIAGKGLITASYGAAPTVNMTEDASTSITLNCGDGVALGADAAHATEFWFAMPATTFRNGIKITATDVDGNVFIKKTNKTVNITRNDIQPMAALPFVSNAPAATKLWYTRADDKNIPVEFYNYEYNKNPFDAKIISHKWDDNMKRFVIEFNAPLTTIKAFAFRETALAAITLPESVTTIEKEAFRKTQLTEITIPGNINTIGVDAFYDCDKLTSVTFNPSQTETPLKIGYTISASDVNGPFYYSPLTTINLDRALVLIDENGASFTPNDWAEGHFANKYYNNAEYMNRGMSVTIGEQVKTIPNYMFAHSILQSITIPASVTAIGENTFIDCDYLNTIVFENGNTPLKVKYQYASLAYWGPFYDSPLTSITLGREIEYIKADGTKYTPGEVNDGFFASEDEVDQLSVTISDKVKTISEFMFAGRPVQQLTIPANVTTIGNGAFDGCTKLTSLTFEQCETALEIMGQDDKFGPFYDSPLTTIHYNRNFVYKNTKGSEFVLEEDSDGIFAISDDIKNVLTTAEKATTVNIGPLIQIIPDRMFCNLPIAALTIPGTVTTIGNNVFNKCDKLASLRFEAGIYSTKLTIGYNTYDDEGDAPFLHSPLTSVYLNRELIYTLPSADLAENGTGVFSEHEALKSVTFGDQVRTLSDYMFSNTGITSLTIPSTVTTIGKNVFIDCDDLTSVIISSSTLGSNMFDDCDKLATVTIDGTLDAINVDAFTGCSKLSTLNISGSVETIGDGSFDGFNLTSLNISGHVGTIGANAFDDNDKMTSFTVTSTGSIGTIGAHAFDDCDALTLDIQGSVDRVGTYAFSDCDAITTLSIRANVVEDYAYEDMDGLKTATLYGATVGKYVFYDCNSLETLVIDGGVNSIGNNAFDKCNKLSSVTFKSGSQDLHIGFQYGSISDKGTFYDSPLTNIDLDRQLVYDYDDLNYWDEGIFASQNYDNENLKVTVTLGLNVKTILPWMFSGVRMEKLEIPNSVTHIGDMAFSYCYILTEVSCRNTTAPTLGNDVFLNDKDKYNNNLLIKVPYISGDEYRSKWSQYEYKIWPTFVN